MTVKAGDRVAALLVWGGYAEVVCVAESSVVNVPDDVDPAVLVSVVFPYMTAYQLLHRAAQVRPGETVLYHGAAGRVGVGVLELAGPAGVTVYGTATGSDCAIVEHLGGIAIDYNGESFLEYARNLPDGGVDVALDGIGGVVSYRSFRALRPGGRLVLFGHQSTIANGRRSRRRLVRFYAWAAVVVALGLVTPGKRVGMYRIAKLRDRHPDWFRHDLQELIRLLRDGSINPVVVERIPLADARRAHELLETSAARGKIVLIPCSARRGDLDR
jgi:NADPH2:quinone reductase